MDRELLNAVIAEQQKEFEEGEIELVGRELSEKIIELLPLKTPFFITGVRRCGKSSLLRILKDRLGLKQKDFLYVNFNDERLANFSVEDFQKILDFSDSEDYGKNCVFFIDEMQEAQGWEKWVDRIKDKHAIFVTGSNSKLLSKEISTTLTGRSINIGLSPFSFREFLKAKKIDDNKWKLSLETQAKIRKAFEEFMQTGGFPKRVLSGQKIVVSELYENILYRDVIGKFNKKLSKQIKEMSLFLLTNSANAVSYRELAKITEIKNVSTVKSIIDAFENSFLFFLTNKFDYSIKKQVKNPKKIYCIDNGFITTAGFRFSQDNGRLLENAVAVELKRRGGEVYYSKNKNECDFLVKKGVKITSAIQACYNLNEGNKERETNGLTEALKKFGLKEGLILTYDQEQEIKRENKKITVKPVWKWLLEQQ